MFSTETVSAGSGFTELVLSTNFTSNPVQWFTVAWQGGDDSALINVQVAGTTVIPLPATGWLLLGGLASLAALRRRQLVA